MIGFSPGRWQISLKSFLLITDTSTPVSTKTSIIWPFIDAFKKGLLFGSPVRIAKTTVDLLVDDDAAVYVDRDSGLVLAADVVDEVGASDDDDVLKERHKEGSCLRSSGIWSWIHC